MHSGVFVTEVDESVKGYSVYRLVMHMDLTCQLTHVSSEPQGMLNILDRNVHVTLT